MEDIRWILLISGAILVAGIIFYESYFKHNITPCCPWTYTICVSYKENNRALSVISQETSPDCPQQGFHQNNKTPDCSSNMENHMEYISFKQSVLINFQWNT